MRIVSRLPAFVDASRRKVERAVTQAVIIGSSNASIYTPIDTSTLLNSQSRRIEWAGPRCIGTVTYTAEYAGQVHDPDHQQTFKRPSAKKEFLRFGFEDAKAMIDKAVIGALA